eukprot:CAMPEP_0175121388 /NCGR_PEP_ID=MMETSP0087-20121206/1139_1 /TAXON_ID=136419 /ORGANISM="Unknown Unknown, Strain D1" /LENGTH=150 /DNA_ID=CAMNT_0016402921 /DNA_START=59 /DNA_END=511 /DNA_ORIENTATION=-
MANICIPSSSSSCCCCICGGLQLGTRLLLPDACDRRVPELVKGLPELLHLHLVRHLRRLLLEHGPHLQRKRHKLLLQSPRRQRICALRQVPGQRQGVGRGSCKGNTVVFGERDELQPVALLLQLGGSGRVDAAELDVLGQGAAVAQPEHP